MKRPSRGAPYPSSDAEGNTPEAFTDDLPNELRVQIVYIMKRAIGVRADRAWEVLHERVAEEHGRFKLADGHTALDRCVNFLLQSPSVDHALDLIDASFRFIEVWVPTLSPHERPGYEIRASVSDSIEKLNERFRQAGVGYRFEGMIVRVDSELIHSEVIRPALRFLHQSGFEGPREEFLRAHAGNVTRGPATSVASYNQQRGLRTVRPCPRPTPGTGRLPPARDRRQRSRRLAVPGCAVRNFDSPSRYASADTSPDAEEVRYAPHAHDTAHRSAADATRDHPFGCASPEALACSWNAQEAAAMTLRHRPTQASAHGPTTAATRHRHHRGTRSDEGDNSRGPAHAGPHSSSRIHHRPRATVHAADSNKLRSPASRSPFRGRRSDDQDVGRGQSWKPQNDSPVSASTPTAPNATGRSATSTTPWHEWRLPGRKEQLTLTTYPRLARVATRGWSRTRRTGAAARPRGGVSRRRAAPNRSRCG